MTDANFGTVDYAKGEVIIGADNPITVVNTTVANSVVEVRATPQSQDILATRTAGINFDIANSNIVSLVDNQISGS